MHQRLAIKELERLRLFCSKDELNKLNFNTLDGYSTEGNCLYGQITGNPDSFRAIDILLHVTDKLVCNDVIRDGKMVNTSELAELAEGYFNESTIRKQNHFESDIEQEEEVEVITEELIVDCSQRSLHYVSSLELWVPALNDPDRQEKITEIRTILGV